MASLSYSCTTSTLLNPLIAKPLLPSIRQNQVWFTQKVSFKLVSKNNKEPPQSSSETRVEIANSNKLDRRDVLIGGLGGLYSAIATFHGSSNALAAPIEHEKKIDEMVVPRVVKFPRVLDSMIRTQVVRPRISSRSKEEEVLVIDLELSKRDRYIKFDVYINEEEEDNPKKLKESRVGYAGSFVSLSSGYRHKDGKTSNEMKSKTCLTLGLTDLIEDIGPEDDDNVDVLLVPTAGKGLVVITDVRIEFLS